jgi:A/G-specific adenine glycosylase
LIAPAQPASFRRALFRWYRKKGRDLPWRRTRDPYAILVSEFMLQQTQVATVLPYYIEWLRRFPDFAALAAADQSEVLRAWEGLGYYSRARNLHGTAKTIVAQHCGVFPRTPADIRRLPGVGRYTANAVATFAFDAAVPLVEANTARVLARLHNLQISIDSTAGRNALWLSAEALLPTRSAGLHNSALMDLGAVVCTARQPKCDECPVSAHCRAENPTALPRKNGKPSTKLTTEAHAFTIQRGRILLEQAQQRWRAMWILPPLASGEALSPAIYSAKFPFTHHRITLAVFARPAGEVTGHQRWFAIGALSTIPIASPHRRAIESLIPALEVGRPLRRSVAKRC